MSYKAFIEALAEIHNLPLDSTGYGYSYTSLPKILEHVKPILAKHGLGMVQSVFVLEGNPAITTDILSEKGETVFTSGVLTCSTKGLQMKSEAQSTGAVITYLRRYQIAALLGISGDEDTDAAPVEPPKQAKPKAKAKPATKSKPKHGTEAMKPNAVEPPSTHQIGQIRAHGITLWGDKAGHNIRELCLTLGIPQSSDKLDKRQAAQLVSELDKLVEDWRQ